MAYLGIGRVFPFLKAVNEFFESKGIALPLEGQATTTTESRREAGTQAQVNIFGEHMRDFWKSGPEESRHINLWLADNCFGDYYTRKGLDYAERELILVQNAGLGIVTLAEGLIMISGGFDMTIGNVISFSGCCAAVAMANGANAPSAVLIGLLVATACGLLNGVLVVVCKALSRSV